MDRLSQKHDLLVKLGQLIGPLQHAANHPEQYDEQEIAETIARFLYEHEPFHKEFERFSVGQPGHKYQIQYKKLLRALFAVSVQIEAGRDLREVVADCVQQSRDAINEVPVPSSSVVLEAGSPFTAYCKLRSVCEADALHEVLWFDPYFSDDVFHRYLQHVSTEVCVTLVASEPSARAGRANRDRWTSFLDVSRLFAAERGTSGYCLRVAPSLHDRWIIFDDKRCYALGGSAKDAAAKDIFTIAALNTDSGNLDRIHNTRDTADEWFGPNRTTHQ